MIMKESFVEVSPSIVMALKERSAISRVRLPSKPGAKPASVAIKPNMVAIFGWIMPAPLQMPVITTGPADVDTVVDVALGWVSVVMMACAASSQWSSPKLATAFGKALIIFSIGKGSKITPVEKGRICSGLSWRSFANAAQVSSACFIPDSPVPALALPVFTTRARISPLRPSCAKCSRQT